MLPASLAAGLGLLSASLPEICLNKCCKQMEQSQTITLGFLSNMHKMGYGWGCLLSARQAEEWEQPQWARAPSRPPADQQALPCLWSLRAPGGQGGRPGLIPFHPWPPRLFLESQSSGTLLRRQPL